MSPVFPKISARQFAAEPLARLFSLQLLKNDAPRGAAVRGQARLGTFARNPPALPVQELTLVEALGFESLLLSSCFLNRPRCAWLGAQGLLPLKIQLLLDLIAMEFTRGDTACISAMRQWRRTQACYRQDAQSDRDNNLDQRSPYPVGSGCYRLQKLTTQMMTPWPRGSCKHTQ